MPRRPTNPVARKFNIDTLRKARVRGVSSPVDALALATVARLTRIGTIRSSPESNFVKGPMQYFQAVLALLLTLASTGSLADIYGYVDEQGVSHFSAEKLDARYQVLARGNKFGTLDLGASGNPRPLPIDRLTEHPDLKRYEPFLKAASSEYSIELALLKAIAAAESGFNPDAVSPKGAIGLMQMMPATAERYGLAGDKRRSLEMKLRDPQTNIRLGARYLADLFKLYPRQQHLVLASYNAGEGAVKQYNNTIPPYPETRNYVELVTQLHQVFSAKSLVKQSGGRVVVRYASPGSAPQIQGRQAGKAMASSGPQ